MPQWQPRDILMAIKAYPNPVEDLGEAICAAGVDRDGNWLRLYPIAFRDLPFAKQFKKYQWIRGRIAKSSADTRPESYVIDHDSIEPLETVDTSNRWARRKELLAAHILPSVEALWGIAAQGGRTMAYVRPAGTPELVIEEREAGWSLKKAGLLAQARLFGRQKAPLERIPFRFAYKFHCEGLTCGGHNMQILDWEVHQSYRAWRGQYGEDGWREKFVEKYGPDFFARHDVLFNLGNIAKHPDSFCITGLFYPTKGG